MDKIDNDWNATGIALRVFSRIAVAVGELYAPPTEQVISERYLHDTYEIYEVSIESLRDIGR